LIDDKGRFEPAGAEGHELSGARFVSAGGSMVHQKQRTTMDCGLAAAAMALGVEYEVVREAAPEHCPRRGVRLREMMALLAELDPEGGWRVSNPRPRPSLEGWVSRRLFVPEGVRLLIVRRPEVSFGHWVAWEDGLVFDPEHQGPRPVAGYRRRAWDLVRIVTPGRGLGE
jgi:hypothetical protein